VSLIKTLLDIDKYPSTPNYQIASGKRRTRHRHRPILSVFYQEMPLVLFDCQFDGVDWICDQAALRVTICHLQRHWASFQVRATMIKSMLNQLESRISDPEQLPILGQLTLIDNDSNSLLGYNNHRRGYQPILTRTVRHSVEMKIEKFHNKKTQLESMNAD
jgi:hypothetical protein